MKSLAKIMMGILCVLFLCIGCSSGGGGGSDEKTTNDSSSAPNDTTNPGSESDTSINPGSESGSATYSISGTVVSTDGGALVGATLTLSGVGTGTTVTDQNGYYTFSGLASGSYTVNIALANYTFNPVSQAVTINGSNIPSINYTGTVNPASTYGISGRITASGGGALSGATLTLSGAGTGTATTNGSGDYSFIGLTNGIYTIKPSLNEYLFSPSSLDALIENGNVNSVNFTGSKTSSDNPPTFINDCDPSQGGCVTIIYNYSNGALSGISSHVYVKNTGGAGIVNVTVSAGNYTENKQFNVEGNARYELVSVIPVSKISGSDILEITASFSGTPDYSKTNMVSSLYDQGTRTCIPCSTYPGCQNCFYVGGGNKCFVATGMPVSSLTLVE